MLEKLFIEKILDSKTLYDNKETITIEHDKFGLYILYLTYEGFCYAFKSYRTIPGGEDQEAVTNIIIDPVKVNHFLQRCDPDIRLTTQYALLRDPNTNQGAFTYYLYKNDPNRKNYIVSKNLSNCLSKINMSIPINAIPKENFNAYFELNGINDDDGALIKGGFVSIFNVTDNYQVISIAVMTDDDYGGLTGYAIEGIFMHVDRDRFKTLEDLYLKSRGLNKRDEAKFKDSSTRRMFLNAMLYVTNPNEEFKEEYNKFATKESKRKVQKKIYSNEAITKIGYGEDTTFLKMLVTKKTEVDPYWRTQHFGPKNTYTKYILVSGYERKQHAYFDQTREKKI